MENTFISHELEEMRSQINILKDKLEKQTIVNEEHIRRSMKSKMSDINRTITITIFLGLFALVYCTWFFCSQGCSLSFVIATAVMLAVCLVVTLMQKITVGRMDMSKENLVQTARELSKLSAHYKNWHKIALPMILVWLVWLLYEMIGILGIDTPYAIGFYCGALVGVIIGGFAGFRINRKVVRKAEEILSQIQELQKES